MPLTEPVRQPQSPSGRALRPGTGRRECRDPRGAQRGHPSAAGPVPRLLRAGPPAPPPGASGRRE